MQPIRCLGRGIRQFIISVSTNPLPGFRDKTAHWFSLNQSPAGVPRQDNSLVQSQPIRCRGSETRQFIGSVSTNPLPGFWDKTVHWFSLNQCLGSGTKQFIGSASTNPLPGFRDKTVYWFSLNQSAARVLRQGSSLVQSQPIRCPGSETRQLIGSASKPLQGFSRAREGLIGELIQGGFIY